MLYRIDAPFKKSDIDSLDGDRARNMCATGFLRIKVLTLYQGSTYQSINDFGPLLKSELMMNYLDGNNLVGFIHSN